MNNLFLFVGILFFFCSMTYGGKHQNKGKQPLKAVNGTVLKQKANEMEECSKIPSECYECLCGGKAVSGKGKSAHYGTNRPKRGLCIGCYQYYADYHSLYCNRCSRSYLLIIFLPIGD